GTAEDTENGLDHLRRAGGSRGGAEARGDAEPCSPGRALCTRAPHLCIYDPKIFVGPVERSLRPHGAIRSFPSCAVATHSRAVGPPHEPSTTRAFLRVLRRSSAFSASICWTGRADPSTRCARSG